MARKPFQPFSLGRYQCIERIGGGGMAEVFRAKLTGVAGFEKEVAVKRILPHLASNDEFIRMFIKEAKICASLNHANIVRVHELNAIDGVYYISMEYIAGMDLDGLSDALEKSGQALPWELAVLVAMEVCKGLEYAHNLRDADGRLLEVVHRDLSPSNVMISWAGEVRILDFGIAKVASLQEQTRSGALRGKFAYMAPEQIRANEPLDRRADLFSLGVLLYEMIAGKHLFRRETMMEAMNAAEQAAVPPLIHDGQPALPELERVVKKLLARDRNQRFNTATAVYDALGNLLLRNGYHVGAPDLGAFVRLQSFLGGQELSEPQVRRGGTSL